MNKVNIQEQFLSILHKKKQTKVLVELFQEYLNIGKTAAYNRLKGATDLTANELGILSNKFNISLDAILNNNKNTIEFSIPSMRKTPGNVNEFLAGIKLYIEELAKRQNPHVRYVTNEVPLFVYFFYPELISFKFFIWARSIWNWENIQDQKFSVSTHVFQFNLPHETKTILDKYMQIPSTEFWNTNILDNTINQIRYYQAAEVFEKQEDIDSIYNALENVINHAENMAIEGRKFYPGKKKNRIYLEPFNLYYNQFIYTNNTILTNSRDMNSVFTTYDNPNFMKSDDPDLIKYTKNWFDALKKRSTKISGESEKQRRNFFSILHKKIQAARSSKVW